MSRYHPLMRPIDRRTVLRGVGAAMALPWLEAMVPGGGGAKALAEGAAASSAASPLRVAFLFVPNGVDPGAWRPTSVGSDYALPSSLEPLASLRSKFSVLGNLSHRNAAALGDGPGDHARSAACFLTGTHPVKTAGTDIRAGVSIDQVLARRIGDATSLPSLELGCEPALQSGDCDSGYSCAYSANVSWRTPQQPMLKEIRPRAVFERLFASGPSGESAEARRERFATRRSLLDYVRSDASRLSARLGGSDRRKLEEYLDGVRAVERRVESIERLATAPESRGAGPDGGRGAEIPAGVPEDYRQHVTLMNELLVLALRTDRTRVATFMLANEGSNRAFPFLGIAEGHHHLSHHGGDESMAEKIRRINRFQSEMFADLLQRMEAVKEGDGSLLDHSIVVFGSAIADGNRHDHDDLPVILAGGGGGTLAPGRSIRFAPGTPMCNLYASILDRAGAGEARFGDSTGVLAGI